MTGLLPVESCLQVECSNLMGSVSIQFGGGDYRMLALCAFALILSNGLGIRHDAPLAGEFVVRIVESQLSVADDLVLPDAVREDLRLINDKLQSLPIPKRSVRITPDGRAIIAFANPMYQNPLRPHGVWIWPNWQDDAAAIHVSEGVSATLVGERYVWIEAPKSHLLMSADSRSCRVTTPPGWRSMNVCGPLWAALASDDSIVIGRFGNDGQLLEETVTFHDVPFDWIYWSGDNEHLLACTGPHASGHTNIVVMSSSGSNCGILKKVYGRPYVYAPGRLLVETPRGEFRDAELTGECAIKIGRHWLSATSGTPYKTSPSGRYVTVAGTASGPFVYPVPNAPEEQDQLPATPVTDNRSMNLQWLSWVCNSARQ